MVDEKIIYLDLKKAFYLAIKTFCKSLENLHLRIGLITAATAYIKNIGGIRTKENEIMTFCCDRYIWMTAVHKPGKENVVDIELRTFIEYIE